MTNAVAHARGLCPACPKLCRHLCSVAEATRNESHTPTAKQTFLDLQARGLLAPDATTALAAYHCVGCGAHRAYCRLAVDGRPSLWAARREALARGLAPPGVRRWCDVFRATLARWQAGDAVAAARRGPATDAGAVVLAELERPATHDGAARWAALLGAGGIAASVLVAPAGREAWDLGDPALAEAALELLAAALARLDGTRRLLVADTDTAHWLAARLGEHAPGVIVEHPAMALVALADGGWACARTGNSKLETHDLPPQHSVLSTQHSPPWLVYEGLGARWGAPAAGAGGRRLAAAALGAVVPLVGLPSPGAGEFRVPSSEFRGEGEPPGEPSGHEAGRGALHAPWGARAPSLAPLPSSALGTQPSPDGWATGATGGLPVSAPDSAALMARRMIEAARARGAAGLLAFDEADAAHLRAADGGFVRSLSEVLACPAPASAPPSS